MLLCAAQTGVGRPTDKTQGYGRDATQQQNNAGVGGGPGDLNIDTGDKGRDAGARDLSLLQEVMLCTARPRLRSSHSRQSPAYSSCST